MPASATGDNQMRQKKPRSEFESPRPLRLTLECLDHPHQSCSSENEREWKLELLSIIEVGRILVDSNDFSFKSNRINEISYISSRLV
ncbi:hypothetical protein L1049_020709 [Liquidambar formosana]|uniref:Uncharacterized protein n=1 Tax=Liquidambar formosana TaxID=63359 RepID=A0AAP0SDG6_LIQFO